MRRLFLLIAASLMANACAAVPADQAARQPSAFSIAERQLELSPDAPRGLPPQTLSPNQCGLFLWSKTDISRFIFFMRAGAEEALFFLDDQPTPLRVGVQGGEIFGQFLTDIEFTTPEGRLISLDYDPGAPLEGGARVSDGLIEYADKDGWRIVLPVVGARVCQRANGSQDEGQ